MRRAITTMLLTILATSAASADRPSTVRATLVAPTSARNPIIGFSTTYTCTGTSCSGPASNARHGDERACRELARGAGPVASFEGLKGALPADQLARCNEHARGSH